MSLVALSEDTSLPVQLEQLSGASLGALQRWLLSIACVNFDLELGPDVEFLYPPLEISKEEKDNIAFSSFPDTSVFSDGDLVFSWRVREVPLDVSTSQAPPRIPHRPSGSSLAAQQAPRRSSSVRQSVSRSVSWLRKRGAHDAHPVESVSARYSRSTSYLYGYTYFLQRRDPSLRRGYFQKSLVILTHLPYVGLFHQLIARLGPAFFELGAPVLESFVHDVVRWPAPEPGATLELSALGTVLHASLSHGLEAQNGDGMQPGTDPARPLLTSVPPAPLVQVLYELLPDLWRLWECMLTAEPILVVGHDPCSTSEAVWHLVDMIRPVPLAGDFRPFFHIHDYDFRAFVTRTTPPAGVVLGTTNPFFLQTCANWPHIVHLGKCYGDIHARRNSTQPTAHLASSSKRRVSKDTALIKQLMQWRDSPAQLAHANTVLRRYFADLTERFLAPLHQHMATLIPASFDLSSPAEVPPIKPFQAETFLHWLKSHPGPLRMRQRSLYPASVLRHSLYSDFLHSPNFAVWLQGRVEAAQHEQRQRRIAALAIGDVVTFGRTRSEIESIDLYLRLREELHALDKALHTPTSQLGPSERWRAAAAAASGEATSPGESLPAAQTRSISAQRARLSAQMERLLATIPEDLRVGLS